MSLCDFCTLSKTFAEGLGPCDVEFALVSYEEPKHQALQILSDYRSGRQDLTGTASELCHSVRPLAKTAVRWGSIDSIMLEVLDPSLDRAHRGQHCVQAVHSHLRDLRQSAGGRAVSFYSIRYGKLISEGTWSTTSLVPQVAPWSGPGSR